jgi:hypothetical protein
MNDNEQCYADAWNSDKPQAAIVIESNGAGAGADPASVADMTSQAAGQLAQVAEQAGNTVAEKSAAEYSTAWADH